MLERMIACTGFFRPEETALQDSESRLSCRELGEKIRRIALRLARLREMGLKMAAVECPDLLNHWLLLLGLMRLGIPTASLPPAFEGVTEGALAALQPDLVIQCGEKNRLTDLAEQAEDGTFELLYLEKGWIEGLPEAADDPPQPGPEGRDLPFRHATAGALGGFTPISLSREAADAAVARLGWLDLALGHESARRPVFVSTVHPSSLSGFLAACAALCAGSSVRFHDLSRPAASFVGAGPFIALTTPAHLAMILEDLSPRSRPRPEISLVVSGGRTSDRLVERCARLLTPRIRLVYAAEETGPVAAVNAADRADADDGGPVLPWAEVMVTDAAGKALPLGGEGEIRVRLPAGVAVSEPSGPGQGWGSRSARYGRDRWLVTGDAGRLASSGGVQLLSITGRVDDLATLGGGKTDLARLARAIRQVPCVQDAACFVYEDEAGRERVGCAAVQETGMEREIEAIGEAVKQACPGLPVVPVFWTARLPRDAFGVVDRAALARAAQGRIPAEAGGGA